LVKTLSVTNINQRSNYVENAGALDDDQDGGAVGGRTAKSRGAARQLISDKKDWGDTRKKKGKSTMNVRSALLYRKNFATLVDESVWNTSYGLF
jgi:zinc finger HIT domain-containing protein 1